MWTTCPLSHPLPRSAREQVVTSMATGVTRTWMMATSLPDAGKTWAGQVSHEQHKAHVLAYGKWFGYVRILGLHDAPLKLILEHCQSVTPAQQMQSRSFTPHSSILGHSCSLRGPARPIRISSPRPFRMVCEVGDGVMIRFPLMSHYWFGLQ